MKLGFLGINSKSNSKGKGKEKDKDKEGTNRNERINKHKSHETYLSINPKRSSYSTNQRNTITNKKSTNALTGAIGNANVNVNSASSKGEGIKGVSAYKETKANIICKSPLAMTDEKIEEMLLKQRTPISQSKVNVSASAKANVNGLNSQTPRKNTLDQIMSDGSYQEIDSSEEDDDNGNNSEGELSIGSEENNIKEKENNMDLYLHSINESSKPNVTGVINRFPKLSVNPFTQEDNPNPNPNATSNTITNIPLTDTKSPSPKSKKSPQAQAQSHPKQKPIQQQLPQSNKDETLEMKYRKLLSLAKKGDRESFIDLLETILQSNGNIDYQDESGWTALHYASDEGNLKIVEILLKANSDVNCKSQNKRTPLHITASHGYFDISKLLVENGAMINTNDNEKNTPLHLCSMSGHVELLKYFIDKYPQADSKNIYGKTPLQLASKPEIKDLLKEYMNKKGSVYHKIKIHKTNDTVMNNMLNKKPSPLKIAIDANVLGGSSNNNQQGEKDKGIYTPQPGTTAGSHYNSNQNKFIVQPITIATVNLNANPNQAQSTPSNRIMIPKTVKHQASPINYNSSNVNMPKKNSISNFSINPSIKKKGAVSSAIKLPKTKTLTKFNQVKFKENGMPKEDIDNNASNIVDQSHQGQVQTQKPKKSDQAIITLYDDQPDYNYNCNSRLNKTEEIAYNKQNQIELTSNTNEDNLFSQINLNSIEEERITPNSFVCLALIGRGSFGEVYLVEKISTKLKYAMKVLDKDRVMGQNLLKYAMAERNVLSLTNHPFIVKLNYAFQTTNQLFLILDYCPGGDLSKHLYYEKRFTEERAKYYICEILLALEDLHKRDIIFRDLKPDNVVLDMEGHAKLTDFGLSKEGVSNSVFARSFCGSIAYLAPEMLKKQGHGKAVDWYLLGVLFYEMLVGIPPYFTEQKEDIFRNIESGELQIPKFISKEASEILKALLKRDPNKRLGGGERDGEEIKEHKYFAKVNWKDVYERKIPPPKAKRYNKPLQTYNHPRMFQQDVDDEELLQHSANTFFNGWSFINNEDDQ